MHRPLFLSLLGSVVLLGTAPTEAALPDSSEENSWSFLRPQTPLPLTVDTEDFLHKPQASEEGNSLEAVAEEIEPQEEEIAPLPSSEGHSINFDDVPVEEFIRFVSKISQVNFIFDKKDLQFNVSLTSGKSVDSKQVLKALLRVLRVNGCYVKAEETGYFVIYKLAEGVAALTDEWEVGEQNAERVLIDGMAASVNKSPAEPYSFFVYKLKYHQGAEIQEAMKQVALDLKTHPDTPQKLLNAIQSVQWVKVTNSLLCSGEPETLTQLKALVDTLDTALKQVFIEVLVIETDVRKSLDFGLQWAAGVKNRSGFGAGAGSFPSAVSGSSPFAETMQGINAGSTPLGLSQVPVGSGFDLGVIGDMILHKGRSFFSLGALISSLQADGESTIVLNQKIIAQDNKKSNIFVGENIPFTGSVVQTIGQSQQTTSNIEYRDIGVSLVITPMLGDDGVITLDLQEEISETVSEPGGSMRPEAGGIRTTKTNMVTHVHVPDKHFLVLSGMVRNAKAKQKVGVPCLGGIPYIGSLFSKTSRENEKRNVVIFVRPHIINSVDDYKKITEMQRELHKRGAPSAADYEQAFDYIPPSS